MGSQDNRDGGAAMEEDVPYLAIMFSVRACFCMPWTHQACPEVLTLLAHANCFAVCTHIMIG